MNRRDVLFGGGLLFAAAGAAYLQPRERLVLLPDGRNLEDLVPKAIGPWNPVESDAFVLPKVPGSLADRLYNQTISRLYVSETRHPVMMVVAYGAVQNDLLQLHRPEVCYTAVGFSISASRVTAVSLSDSAKLPIRVQYRIGSTRDSARAVSSRIGDDLPTTGREQRWVKLRQQMDGYLADGILVRLSTIGEPSPEAFAELSEFARTMVTATAPKDRPTLIGRPLAGLL
jgi:EpsI family protein